MDTDETSNQDMADDEPDLRTEEPESDDPGGSRPALLQLHGALKKLDHALFEARRALDVALDRAPEDATPTDLPYKELRRLAQELERSSGDAPAPTRARIRELLDAQDREDQAGEPERQAVVGVAPSGKLRGD